ncbi:phosphoglycerate dehydrogenase [Mariniblastus fucicola]|uniref:D-3-phosphoglycerate dehydrogenase n=1 Tax=Mariniblastus fucicola TaxID=980251 RepID=A0A5B9PBW7_9BACT|nr:phosphoglycerate dehydrogenase [Mariniblastus fucicola]QEG23808.1 D-3-phosphoglycerate dehydrogenase [Mariniblastus fucicola]
MSVATEKNPAATNDGTYRVIVLDDLAEEGLAKLDAAPNIQYDIRTKLAGEELRQALSEYDGAVCRSGVKITAESLEGNTQLKAIVRAGVGTDNIDKVAAARLGIVVMNTPAGNTVSTAEHTMALLLGLSRKLAPAHASLKAGAWDRKKFKGSQVFGKTLGVVGLGRIGQEVSARAAAFGMEVVGYDPFLSRERAEELGIRKVDTVDEMLPEIDYLTVHTPLTPETTNLISTEQVARIKKGARLINCARGGIYDEGALEEGLKSGQLGGVALDVYPDEPCTDSPLFAMDNVLCTPHLGASTEEAQIGVAVEAVDLLVNYLVTGEIQSAVNTTLDPNALKTVRPYADVAYRLGILLGQWHGGGLKNCELEFQGEIAEKDTRILVSAFCAGLIRNFTDEANIINAELLCRERGIELSRKESTAYGTFSSQITATVSGDGKTCSASGTVFGKDMPRLIRLGEYRTEAFMDGNLLVFHHQDVPGIIGYVGSVLSEENVNIAQMAVGRQGTEAGGSAIGVLNLDSGASEKALARVTEKDGIESAILLQLPEAGDLPDWLA